MPGRTPRFVTRTMATTFATVVFILAAVLLVVQASAAAAQEAVPARVSAETVVSASMFSGNQHPAGMLDATVRVEAGGGATVIVRPWAWRRPNGTWTAQFYQLQLRYQSRTRLPLRLDAGIITSPLGLSTLQ